MAEGGRKNRFLFDRGVAVKQMTDEEFLAAVCAHWKSATPQMRRLCDLAVFRGEMIKHHKQQHEATRNSMRERQYRAFAVGLVLGAALAAAALLFSFALQ